MALNDSHESRSPAFNGNPDPAAEEEINLLELVGVLVRRKMMIIRITAAAALAAVIYSLTMPNIYSATARLLPPQKEGGGGLSALLGQAGGLAGLAGVSGLGGSSDLYLGILKSRSVADAVIKKLNLKAEFKAKTDDAARLTLAQVVKTQAGKDGIITITADSKKPEMAARLANTMVQELQNRSVQLNLTKAGTERQFLEKRLEVVKADLKQAEEALKAFSIKNKTLKVDAQASATIEGIARLKAEIVSKEVQLSALRSHQTDESPEVKALQAALTRLRSQVGTMAGGGSSGDPIPTVGSVPGLGLDYARLLRELKTQEAIFEQLTRQYEVVKLTEAKDSSTIQVLDDAVVPAKKSKPKRSLVVILATVTAFFCSVMVAFVQEYLAKMNPEDRALLDQIRSGLFRFRRETP